MIRSCSLITLLLMAPAAHGADWAPDLDGHVWAGFHTVEGAAKGFGHLDGTVTFDLSRKHPLSFEVGTFEFILPGKTPHETYVALTWNDKLSLGVVRPAYDSVLTSGFDKFAPFLSYDRAELSRALTTTAAMRRNAVPFGVSWQDQTGALSWAVSAHAERDSAFQSASAAISYQSENLTTQAAIEAVWPHAQNVGFNTKIGARYHQDSWEFAITYLHPSAQKRPDHLSLEVVLHPSRDLSVYLNSELSEDEAQAAHGIGAIYSLSDKTALTGALTQSGDDNFAEHFGLSYRF